MTTGPLTCREFVELATDYLEGALPPEEHARFEQHLVVCDGCEIYLEQMRQTVEMLGRLTEEDLSAEAQEQLLAVFRHWKGKEPGS
jgi:anti-sigma factor RsiW